MKHINIQVQKKVRLHEKILNLKYLIIFLIGLSFRCPICHHKYKDWMDADECRNFHVLKLVASDLRKYSIQQNLLLNILYYINYLLKKTLKIICDFYNL